MEASSAEGPWHGIRHRGAAEGLDFPRLNRIICALFDGANRRRCTGSATILRKAGKKGVRVILCSPVIIGERDYSRPATDVASVGATWFRKQPRKPGFDPAAVDAEVGRYVEKAREVAAEEGVAFCDLRKVFRDYLAAHNPDNRLEGILTYDGLHPNARGHELIAATILPYLRADEAIKREPFIRRILRPFTNRKVPLFWKTLSRFDKSIK